MAFWGQPCTLESLRSSGGGEAQGVLLNSVLCGRKAKLPKHTGHKANSNFDLNYEQRLYVENLGAVQDESHAYQALEYSGGLGEGAAYRPPYSQDESTDEGRYKRPQHMRSYVSMVMQPMLPAWAEYAQYVHPVDEALLQHLEWAGQPVPATAAFLQDDLAVMVVEGLLDQIELMKRQRVSVLEQIEHVGKCKAPTFEEPMVEPKQARALSQRPQELAWAPAHTVA
ncbi:hypothetical protein C0995_009034 [Termitomyces sp. Mi166|nr:hypothetical protein C0995_009034 [Termitomyces sp. Mi166\